MIFLDCTLRDGGYYNLWDFRQELVAEYLHAMACAGVDCVELGFRSMDRTGFRGAFAYTTDAYLATLDVPERLRVGVMVNASELLRERAGVAAAVDALFAPKRESKVDLVRVACHLHEFEGALAACSRLRELGYLVGYNLMQVAECPADELEHVGRMAAAHDPDVLYFADSLGSLDPDGVARIIGGLRRGWAGTLGIHTHDNMGNALANTLRAIDCGVEWVDSTVTGMGRGPGNAKTELVAIEVADRRGERIDITPLLALVRERFAALQASHGWGSNPYYYLAGKHRIHPTFIQEMLSDARYGATEILSVIAHLREVGATRYSTEALDAGRHMYGGEADGSWQPAELMADRDVLVLGAGPGIAAHRRAIEQYIRTHRPLVIALNTQGGIDEDLIDLRAACHPFRLLADVDRHARLRQPLLMPASRVPEQLRQSLQAKAVLDFGLSVRPGAGFEFLPNAVVSPSSLVIAYVLGAATSGRAARVLLAGFDGYPAGDPRSREMDELLQAYAQVAEARPLLAITPSRYKLSSTSVYAL